jgi:hypothetical protein
LREISLPKNTPQGSASDGLPALNMSLEEKCESWISDSDKVIEGEEKEDTDGAAISPAYLDIESFLHQDLAYSAMLRTARSIATLTPDAAALRNITQSMERILNASGIYLQETMDTYQVQFDIDWDLFGFFKEQNYDASIGPIMERVITITGTADNAQALTCLDYMNMVWPLTARDTLKAIQKAMTSNSNSNSNSSHCK